ncbi:Sodium/pantothenate symporter [Posidoniimonas polymericola]|uniref:Sodium/pantothenate symporter n=1 Tax=Posidoniimonas polymericola TaxID=2528002 RepID=A0A5C5YRF9_9BACT|nr:sodium:solute symporter family protein [Posidoniimonas polymericola]TWT77516.1 Sodium/pantothenate symporter [Posidoniimonas polymericola]
MLLGFVLLYLAASVAIGLLAARKVHNTTDYAVAGRSLPLPMVVATTFATWFGSETVLGIPAIFIVSGLGGTVEDPWGAGLCLVLVGVFYARRLYRMSLLTVGDFYRRRYGRVVEVFCSAVSILSYLGWVAAQVTALGLVFEVLSGGAITGLQGSLIGMAAVLLYTLFGGMWSVALTDSLQMTVIVIGLTVIAVISGQMAGGPSVVLERVASDGLLRFLPPADFHEIVFFIGAGVTIMLGSIPQQDVFQRVTSARDEQTAAVGPVIGGLAYMAFSVVPMFIVASALIISPEGAAAHLETDPEKILPALILDRMPPFTQVLFFGALLSAIMSTASATILAPSTIFVQNIMRHLLPSMTDRQELRLMRGAVLMFSVGVLVYALAMHDKSIYELVSSSYQIPLVGAFVPLTAGLYWRRATNRGAVSSLALGVGVWILFFSTTLGGVFPSQLAGLLAAVVGMIVGSLLLGGPNPQLGPGVTPVDDPPAPE